GLGARPGGVVGGRLGVAGDLADGTEVEPVLGASLSHAQLAADDAAAGLGPEFHVGEHSCLPRSGSLSDPDRSGLAVESAALLDRHGAALFDRHSQKPHPTAPPPTWRRSPPAQAPSTSS